MKTYRAYLNPLAIITVDEDGNCLKVDLDWCDSWQDNEGDLWDSEDDNTVEDEALRRRLSYAVGYRIVLGTDVTFTTYGMWDPPAGWRHDVTKEYDREAYGLPADPTVTRCIVTPGVDRPDLWECKCAECLDLQRQAALDSFT